MKLKTFKDLNCKFCITVHCVFCGDDFVNRNCLHNKYFQKHGKQAYEKQGDVVKFYTKKDGKK